MAGSAKDRDQEEDFDPFAADSFPLNENAPDKLYENGDGETDDNTAEYPGADFECGSLNSADFESLESFNSYLYATTPPNHRAQIRVKGKNKSFRAKVIHAKSAIEKQEQESSRKTSIPLRFLELGNEDMSDSDLIGDASVTPSNDVNARRKKVTQRRIVDRNLKTGLNPYSETELSSAAAESMTVDTVSRFQCVHQTLATKAVADSVPLSKFKMPTMHLSPSFTGLKIPKDRFDFHHTFTMLISLGNTSQKKDISDKYLRQLSSEQEMWRSNLSDMIWLELQARLNGCSVEDQDNVLGAARQCIGKTLQRILDFRITSPAGDNAACPNGSRSEYSEEMLKWCQMSCMRCGMCLREAILAQAAALKQITALLQELEAAESLFPTQKALAKEHAVYTTPEFQQQLGTLCLWQNITIDIARKLLLVAKIISIESVEGTPWSCVDLVVLERMAKTTQEQPMDSEEDMDEEEEDDDGDDDDDDDDDDEEDAEEEGQQSNSCELSAGASKKRVCFNDNATELGHQVSSDSNSHASNPSVARNSILSRNNSVENVSLTLLYRQHVDRTLKKTGLKKFRLRLKELLNPTLQRTRLALLKPKEMAELAQKSSSDQYSAEERNLLYTHGAWSAQFGQMNLPSFRPTYLFLVHILLDVLHECLKLRLEQRPETEPSLLSLRPLICECKEIVNVAVIIKQYYLHLVSPVASGLDFESNLDPYEETLKEMLEVYFNYIQAWMNGLQLLPEMSKRLKNFLEEEWNFTKKVCPHVRGGEANAAKRFCVMASSLLRSISDFLETGIDDCVNQLYDIQAAELSPELTLEKNSSFSFYSLEQLMRRNQRLKQDITKTCRKFKENFHEARERSSKALGFAKMLRKDLEVAAEFSIEVPLPDLFMALQETSHARVKLSHETNYQLFIPEAIASSGNRILQLLNVTCGCEDISLTSDPDVDGYLLLVNCEQSIGDDEDVPQWKGDEVAVELTADTTIALVHIEVDGLLFVVIHSGQLLERRRAFQNLLGGSLKLINDQKSCHKHIADSMMELKSSALDLRKRVAKAIKQVDDRLNPASLAEMADAEKDAMQKLFCETLHQCYNFGFEYHKEVTRLVSGEMRSRLSKALIKFAQQWMKFVMEKCERGRGRRPRWASHGLDFLGVACELRVLESLTNEQFEELKMKINVCITHIIGEKVPASVMAPGFRVGSPDVGKQNKMMRHTSMPETNRNSSKIASASRLTASVSEPATPYVNSAVSSRKSISSSGISTIPDQEDDPGITFKVHDDLKGDIRNHGPSSQLSAISSRHKNMMKFINELEAKQQGLLHKQNLIGRVTNKRVEDYRITIRGVNFRWQRGIKIGEGQFGKVYTAVNIDSGVLMAMKEIPLQPNDHQAIRTLVDEIKIFEGISHPSLVHYYGIELHRDEMIIFMEYCQNGTIADLARQECVDGGRMGLSEGMIRKYTSEILMAIHILHENAIVHRDIKGANVFLTPDGHVKLGDFGCSVKLKNHTTMPGELKPCVGTPAFMAPEVIANSQEGSGRAADIWGLACVIIEMATGKRPWPDMEHKLQIMFHVGMGNSPPIPSFLSHEGQEFLSHCFEIDPQQRWTASQLQNHQFVKFDEEDP